jgi:hypothetical protein
MGAHNCLLQLDRHSYWDFNQYTDWVFPQCELPFTGGLVIVVVDRAPGGPAANSGAKVHTELPGFSA